MSKATKLYIMFALTLISSLLTPIFAQWYQEQTGTFPIVFCFSLFAGGFVSFAAIITDNFKE
jgi:hypothetical protein